MNSDLIWLPVVGYEGIYEVSNDGQVRTCEGKTTYTENRGIRQWKQRVLKQKISKDNTCRVSLWKDGKEMTYLVHRLVANSFIEKKEDKNYINHIDGCRLNNHISNLEWCNHTENNNHAFDNELIKTAHKIKLCKIDSGEEFVFRSKSKAGQFLNKNKSYISSLLLRGITETDGYKIIEL